MSTRKYHVTVEDCIDQDDIQYEQQKNQNSAGYRDFDINQINSDVGVEEMRGSKRQAWEDVDALEEQARSEKMHDQCTARANATEAARIIMEAQQSSG